MEDLNHLLGTPKRQLILDNYLSRLRPKVTNEDDSKANAQIDALATAICARMSQECPPEEYVELSESVVARYREATGTEVSHQELIRRTDWLAERVFHAPYAQEVTRLREEQ